MNINLSDKKYEEEDIKKQNDPVGVLLIVLVVIILVLFGYLLFKKHNLDQNNEKLTDSIRLSSQKIRELTNSDNPAKKIMISKIVKKAKSKRIIWSEVMAKIIKLENSGISFLDFTATKEGEIKARILASDFKSISQFVANLNANKSVTKVVLDGISAGNTLFRNKLEVGINFNLDI